MNRTSGEEKKWVKNTDEIWQKLLRALTFQRDVQNVYGVGDDILRGRNWGQRGQRHDEGRQNHCRGTGVHLLFLNVWGYNFKCDKRQEKKSISCEISLWEYRVLTVKNEAGNRFIRQKTVLWWVLRLLQCINQHDSLDDPLNYTLSLIIHLRAHNLHKPDGQFGFEFNQDRTVFN